ncbi:MAG: sodium-dependent transporter, partial [Clostridia bacterium]|nr:sodium-dependent transporter [Clostridia bacterium]
MAEIGVKNDKNSGFSDRLGFILASAGSAVGLGNIWRFPYLAAKYGGGAFLLTYIILALTIGFSLSLAEIALGRKTGKSSATAFGSLDRRFSFVGYLCLAIPVLVIPYYSVIGGWVIKYAITYLFGGGQVLAEDGYFESFTSSVGEPMLLFLIFLFLTVCVVGLGVKGGIERISKLLMPPLLAFTLFIAVYTLFSVDGAVEGLKYYLLPNFDNFSIMTIVVALGQL